MKLAKLQKRTMPGVGFELTIRRLQVKYFSDGCSPHFNKGCGNTFVKFYLKEPREEDQTQQRHKRHSGHEELERGQVTRDESHVRR